jgi:hypothetical protein
MRVNFRAVGTALATTAAFAVAAAPAAAASHTSLPATASGPSLAKVVGDVHAANHALTNLTSIASSNPAAARSALALGKADIAAAAHQARWLHARASGTTSAAAFEDVATQYNSDVKAYTSMVTSTSGSLQTSIAQALTPAIAGRSQALAFLGELAPTLATPAAGTATSTITSVVGSLPTEITSLTGVVGTGDLPTEIEQLIAQAITCAGGVLDAGITELEGIVPDLPAAIQPIVTSLLDTLSSTLATLESTLEGTTTTSVGGTTVGGLLGGLIGTELGQVTTILQGILGDLPGILGGVTGTTGTTGTGTGTGTGTTAGILGMLPFGLGSLLSGLLGGLGISLPGL